MAHRIEPNALCMFTNAIRQCARVWWNELTGAANTANAKDFYCQMAVIISKPITLSRWPSRDQILLEM